ncbi:sensor histidine kinase [Paenibacillaceae bacterium]|nr:sensor histidine kinase [Paenibacillaceae bacterium]
MLFVWIMLWTVAVLLLFTNTGRTPGRWLSLVAFFGGAGALASLLGDHWRPLLAAGGLYAEYEPWLYKLQQACSWASYYGLPYAFLCFCYSYGTHKLPERFDKRAFWLFAVFPLLMLLFPSETTLYPVRFGLLAVWALPYFAIGAFLLLSKKIERRDEWLSHVIVTASVLPATLFACVMNYTMPLFGVYNMWRYNTWPIMIGFTICVGSMFTFGFLGVRLLVERKQLDSSIRVATSGTAMLNHAIKNDLGKIKLFGDKIRRHAVKSSNVELEQDIAIIMNASAHMEQMIRKVHERTQELELVRERVNLPQLLSACLASFEPIGEGRVKVTEDFNGQLEAFVDREQTMEAIHNVIQNALEAMQGTGELHVRVWQARKQSVIEVRDTGPGLPSSQLRKVFEPFYTTKSGTSLSFGLGLAYCHQLMRRQGGSIQMASKPGDGTTVYFYFPKI